MKTPHFCPDHHARFFEVEGVDFNALLGLPIEPSALIQETKARLLA